MVPQTTHHSRGRKPAAAERSGFTLFLVLAVLVVAGAALTTLATASLQRVRDALYAQDDLQRRWGTIGLERTLLRNASRTFERLDERRRTGELEQTSAGVVRDQIELGGMRFDVILADEEAKANLNSVYHAARQRHVRQTVRRLTNSFGQMSTRIAARTASAATLRLAPSTEDEESESTEPVLPPAFLNWGDVFDLGRLRQIAGDDRVLAELTGRITLWGSGRINVDRASDEAVTSVCSAVVSDGLARRLLDRYRDQPEADFRLLVEKEIGATDDAARLLRLVREGSSTFSLWTEVSSGRSRSQRCSVMQTDPDGQIKTFEIDL